MADTSKKAKLVYVDASDEKDLLVVAALKGFRGIKPMVEDYLRNLAKEYREDPESVK